MTSSGSTSGGTGTGTGTAGSGSGKNLPQEYVPVGSLVKPLVKDLDIN